MWDFVKNAVVESLDSVPEKYRGLYAENAEKKFEISAAAKAIVGDYVGISGTLAETKSKLKNANDEAASRRVSTAALTDFLKEQGVAEINAENPIESLSGFVGSLVEANKKGKEVKVDLDKIRAEAEKRIGNVTAAKDAELAKMLGSLKKFMIDGETSRALAANKGNVEVLMPHIVNAAKVVQEGDDYVVRVVNADGTLRTNGAGSPMTISELVADMKGNKVFAANFESEAPAGTGTKPGNSGTKPAATNNKPQMTSHDKIKAGLAAMQRR